MRAPFSSPDRYQGCIQIIQAEIWQTIQQKLDFFAEMACPLGGFGPGELCMAWSCIYIGLQLIWASQYRSSLKDWGKLRRYWSRAAKQTWEKDHLALAMGCGVLLSRGAYMQSMTCSGSRVCHKPSSQMKAQEVEVHLVVVYTRHFLPVCMTTYRSAVLAETCLVQERQRIWCAGMNAKRE